MVDLATLLDDLDSVARRHDGRVIRPPFEVTPIFMPGFERGSCPLFIVTRQAEGLLNLLTAIPMKNDEKFFWVVPGFAAGYEDIVDPATRSRCSRPSTPADSSRSGRRDERAASGSWLASNAAAG